MGAKRILDYNYNPIDREKARDNDPLLRFEYDDAIEALADLVIDGKGTIRRFTGECEYKFNEILKPVIYNGVKLELYFTWHNHIFSQTMGLYQYTGKMSD